MALDADMKAARKLKRQKRAARRERRAAEGATATAAAEDKAAPRTRPSVYPGRGAERGKPGAARKVLVIGFQKTGTTTMTDALRVLGLSVGHAAQPINAALKAKRHTPEETDAIVRRIAFEIADRADAVQDSPYPLLFRELDARYPGSKFIYLERDPDSWVKSVIGHFGGAEAGLRDWIYGESKAVGNEEIYRQRFVDHRDEVREYFADRPNDILYMDLSRGDGWYQLVSFLGADMIPPFPHRNKRS